MSVIKTAPITGKAKEMLISEVFFQILYTLFFIIYSYFDLIVLIIHSLSTGDTAISLAYRFYVISSLVNDYWLSFTGMWLGSSGSAYSLSLIFCSSETKFISD